MKKLLQINVTANWGSTGKIAEQIGQLAMSHGWDSYIAYGRMMNKSKSKLIKIGTQWDVYSHYALGKFFDIEGLASKRATKKLVKEIERLSPNVIHLHNIHDHYLNYPILFDYLSTKDIPVIWTQHDLWAVTGGCFYVPEGCDKWRTGCYNCPLRKGNGFDKSSRNWELKKEKFSSLKSLTLVPVSEWLGDLLNQSFLNKCDVRVIHNGIDVEMFKPQEGDVYSKYGIEGKKIVLGVASEWNERKGLRDLYFLSERLPSREYVIIVVGKIIDKAKQENSNGCRMIFVDRTQNVMELAQLYTAASVFVNPTYQDNYPTTNLEAMACGTPVITYRTGGSPESITSETGAIVEQGDIVGLYNAVINLSSNNLEAKNNKCRQRAESFCDKEKCFEEYLNLYDTFN